MRKGTKMLDRDGAEAIALQALVYLAEEPSRLARFLGLTGLEPASLRQAADSPETLAAVLEHVLQDESMLLEFTANRGLSPESVAPAYALLAGASATWD
jgi:hypothetical protein